MVFWLTALALALMVAVILGLTLLRGAPPQGGAAETADMDVYKDQLAAVDRDQARGIVPEDEAERLRTEIKRRLLDADRRATPAAQAAPKSVSLAVTLCAVVVVVGGSLALYRGLGAAGYPDMPFAARIEAAAQVAANRPNQVEAERQTNQAPPPAPNPEFLDLVERLRAAVAARPDDVQGLRLLARNEAGLGNYADAASAQARLIEALGAEASDTDWAAFAELRLLADEGVVGDTVTQALQNALDRNATQPMARYFTDLIAAAGPDGGPLPLPGALARRGDLIAAHAAQARLIELLGERATGRDHADHADLMILAAGGYVSPEAEGALNRALALTPGDGTARYYVGLMHAQNGRPDRAFRIWETLLRSSAPDAPWVPPIQAQIAQVAAQAGVDYQPVALGSGAGPVGPDADQVAAAEAMSPAERMQMIEGMVAGLAQRLAEDGGTADDWARLIRAYGVLGRTDDAARVWAEAQSVFPDDVTRVPILQAARDAGVEQ